MLKEAGIVEEIRGDKALIIIRQGSHCQSCESRHSCHLGQKGDMRIVVPKIPGLLKNQEVEIGIPSMEILKLSFLVYFVPILMMMLISALSYFLLPEGIQDRPLFCFLLGVLALALTFLPLKRLDKRARATQRFMPRILRVLGSSDSR